MFCMYRSYLCQKKAFKPVTSKQIGLLELVHSDLADFKNTAGKGGKTYYITFVDDYSRYTKVYLLSLINEAEEMFLYKVEVKINWTKKSRDLEPIEVENMKLTGWQPFVRKMG